MSYLESKEFTAQNLNKYSKQREVNRIVEPVSKYEKFVKSDEY